MSPRDDLPTMDPAGNLTPHPSPSSGDLTPHPSPSSGEGGSEAGIPLSTKMERGPGGEVSRRLGRWLLAAFVAALAAAAALALAYTRYLDSPIGAPGDPPLVFAIEPSVPFKASLATLVERGVVTHPLLFKLCGVRAGDDARVKAGSYVLPAELTPRQLWAALVAGPRAARPLLTLPEGSTVWRVAALLAGAGVAPRLELLDVARDPAFVAAHARLAAFLPRERLDRLLIAHPEYTRLEGVLAPDTYDLAPGDDPRAVAGRLIDRFFRTWDEVAGPGASFELNGVVLTPYEVLIVASLVEREVRVPDERRLVASVFLNRLAKGMRLETDPTLVYSPVDDGLVPTPEHRRDAANPFNTYAHPGLPPTPIGSPGRAALEAVLRAPSTDYLFFVARGDGTGRHYFAPTYDEHRRNIIYAERERLK